MLDPSAAGYPGSPLDALLGATVAQADLLVEAPGPVGLLSGVPSSLDLPEGAVREDDVLVLAQDGAEVARGLAGDVPEALDRLAATTAPLAWAGQTPLGRTLVTQDGDRVRVEVDDEVAEELAAGLSGSVPGSPGRRWADLLADASVEEEDGRTVLEARATEALPPTLLRQLVDQGALPPR